MTALTAQRVEEIYRDSLFPDGDVTIDTLPEDAVLTEGILRPTAFQRSRIEPHREEIVSMLHELPTEFQSVKNGGGGGWSFLNACMTKSGEQWTGLHQTQDMLVQLGIGVGAAKYLMDREMWSAFPGGVPYLAVIA